MRDWHCTDCGKLLGKVESDRLHIQFARRYRYVTSLPATGVCPGCGTLNELPVGEEPASAEAEVGDSEHRQRGARRPDRPLGGAGRPAGKAGRRAQTLITEAGY